MEEVRGSTQSKHAMIRSVKENWGDLSFDYWVVVNLAANHSAENEIEYCWAPLSKSLTSVTLPATLPGENKSHLCKLAYQKRNKGIKMLLYWIQQLIRL